MNNRRISLLRPSEMFSSFMDEFFNSPSLPWSNNAIQTDMYEDDTNIYIDLKAPGFARDDIDISIEGDILTVRGSVKTEQEESDKKKKYFFKEIRSEEFNRSLTLPSKVDAAKTKAIVKEGIIKISLPKLSESKAQKITISTD